MQNRICHSCGSFDLGVAIAGHPAVLRCAACGLLVLEDFPTDAERHGFYQEEYYTEDRGDRFLGPLERVVRAFRAARVRDVLRHLPAARSGQRNEILDVGCGRGSLLEIFRSRGWGVHGTQLSGTAAHVCNKRLGDVVRCGELPELDYDEGSLRVVVLYHVLEHLDRPLEYLTEAHRLLRDDGLLVVEVPDSSAPAFRALGRRSFTFDHPHHLFFFTPQPLRALLEHAGFEVSHTSRFSLEYSPFTTLQNLLNALPGEPNRLYRSLMRNADGRRLRRSPWTWAHGLLAAVLGLPALVLSLGSFVLPVGNTLRVYCRRRSPVESLEASRSEAAHVG